MLGLDTLYRNDYADNDIVRIARMENRIILTRDVGLLKKKEVTHGFWIREQNPKKQVAEVLERLDLYTHVSPFRRCIACNGLIKKVKMEDISDRLDSKTKTYFKEFYQCTSCKKLYWKGSHYERMKKMVEDFQSLPHS
jgi:hypothetical protein